MSAEHREPARDDRVDRLEDRLRAASFEPAPAAARMRGLERILAEFHRLYGGGPARGSDEPADPG